MGHTDLISVWTSGFAAAGRSNKGDSATRLQGQIEIPYQRLGKPGVAECDIFQFNVTG